MNLYEKFLYLEILNYFFFNLQKLSNFKPEAVQRILYFYIFFILIWGIIIITYIMWPYY